MGPDLDPDTEGIPGKLFLKDDVKKLSAGGQKKTAKHTKSLKKLKIEYFLFFLADYHQYDLFIFIVQMFLF